VKHKGLILALVCLLLSGGAIILAQVDYDLSWWTADGGGGASSGGIYKMSGTSGQPDAGTMSGGTYKLGGGFWGGGEVAGEEDTWCIYLPLVLENE
jgi:hypothetical protein